jgi:DNA-binding LacI/PurR family transcriptional regulator
MMRIEEEKHQQIVRKVRHEIVTGEYPPGSRLPTSRELAHRFRASSVTINQVLAVLSRDGFIRTRGRHGTFVTATPPHLTVYGMVCFHGADVNNNFFRALNREAERYRSRESRRISVYLGLGWQKELETYNRLVSDVENERLAGLLFTSPPFSWIGTPIVEDRGLPRVCIMDDVPVFPELPKLANDNQKLLERAADYFVERNRRRIAVVATPFFRQAWSNVFVELLAQRGLTTHPHWIQLVHGDAPECAVGQVQLLLHAGQQERPDGLLVFDDNLLAHVAEGVQAAGVRVPDEVDVLSHANFPLVVPTPFPVTLLGYDVREIVGRGFQIIDTIRRGEAPPMVTRIQPHFGHEVKPE